MASTTVPVMTLPRPAVMRQWMAQYHVPAVGIGLVTGDRITSKVYGELSKGIPAPQNTVWGSKDLANVLATIHKIEYKKTDSLPFTDLFAELDMPDTTLGDPIKVLNRMARPHNKRDGIYVFKPYDTDGHVFTTISDLCKLLTHVTHQTNLISLPYKVTETDKKYGWRQLYNSSGDYQGIMHSAAGNGASHVLLILAQSKQAIIILTNSDNGQLVEQLILNQCCPDIML